MGTYNLSGRGQLTTSNAFIGYSGSGAFTQTGGTNSSTLYLAYNPGSTGSYTLSGGQLSGSEYVGAGTAATASFQQSGGLNSGFITIAPGSSYQFSGGTIQITSGFVNAGTFDGANAAGVFVTSNPSGCLIDFSQGSLVNYGSMSVSVGSNSLVILPANFNPASGFGTYNNAGLTHIAGTTLAISPAQGFGGTGTVIDPVNCQGWIAASGNGVLNLANGLTLSGSGNVSLGYGNLTVNDSSSAITGGQLSAWNQYVGSGGTGTLTQSGGTATIGNYVYVGYNAGDAGTYNFSGAASLNVKQTLYSGYSGTGAVVQSGGTIVGSNGYVNVCLGYNASGSGSYSLSGNGYLSTWNADVGYSGSGVFTQVGGIHSCHVDIYLGENVGSSGVYNLSGGAVTAQDLYPGNSGTGTFTQSGGTCNLSVSLMAAVNAGSSGACNLSGGSLLAPWESIGYAGTASFTQSGGTNTLSGTLYLGNATGSSGSYALSGGCLSTPLEYVGFLPGTSGSFQQTGGLNATTTLLIGSGQRYQLSGGTLLLGGGLANGGTVDGGNSPATLIANCLVDLSSGAWTNLSGLSLNMGSNSLLIVPPGFNPATGLAGYSSLGLIHTAGSTLALAAGQGFTGCGVIADPVNCRGTITCGAGGPLSLAGGLTLSGSGNVNLGSNGSWTVNDSVSTVSGGVLAAANAYVGCSGTGSFTHSGGSIGIANNLYLGYNAADSGAYTLSAAGQLSAGTLAPPSISDTPAAAASRKRGERTRATSHWHGTPAAAESTTSTAARSYRPTSTWECRARARSPNRAAPSTPRSSRAACAWDFTAAASGATTSTPGCSIAMAWKSADTGLAFSANPAA